jgi:PAS domain S-box-containing protein
MMSRLTRFLFILILLPLVTYSQSYQTRSYSINDGLASSTILDITQDANGVMWFATTQGITAYDGTTWTNYHQDDGLAFSQYFKITADHKNNIWAFSEDLRDGVSCFSRNKNRWVYHKLNAPYSGGTGETIDITSVSTAVNRDNISFVGVGTMTHGFYIFSSNQWNKVLPIINGKPASPRQWIYDVASLNGIFYLATDEGIYIVNPNKPHQWQHIPIATPLPAIYSIAIDRLDSLPFQEVNDSGQNPLPRIWLTGEAWAGYYVDKTFHLKYHGPFPAMDHPRQYKNILSLADGFGGLWGGNRKVFFNIDKNGSIRKLRLQSTLFSDGAYSLFSDREHNLWVCTFRGAFKISNFYFENYKRQNGLYDDEVSAILEYAPGKMVFGHNGGFSFLEDNHLKPLEINGLDRKYLIDWRVLDMCLDRKSNIWAAISKKGILKISPNRSLKWYRDFKTQHRTPTFSSVMMDDQGAIFTNVNDLVFRLHPGEDRFHSFELPTHPGKAIRRLAKGNQGSIFLFTYKDGLFHLKNDRLIQYKAADNKEANSVFSVFTLKNGQVLVGTAAGLYTIKDKRLLRFNQGGLYINTPVYFILEAKDHSLWFGMNNGVICWDHKAMRHFTMKDGLVGRETNRAAGVVDTSGKIWIGTEMGASCYIRQRELHNRPAPLIELINLDASGTMFSLNQDMELKASQNDLTFHFRGISLIDENAISYRLKLAGFDKEWIDDYKSHSNQIRYTNIPPGKYQFHLQAVNVYGIKSNTASSCTILIKNPFHKTIGFYLLVFAASVILILFISNFIYRKRHSSRLTKQVKLRTKQLEESREELRNIFDNAHDAIMIINPETEVIYEANSRACEIYGFPPSEFIGMSIQEISENLERGKKKVQETLTLGNNQSFESIQYKKDGSRMFLEINASVMTYRGEKVILSVNRDITERKLAELKIQNSLKEKEILLKEIHHRVKNNLQIISSLLDLQIESITEPELLEVLQDSKSRLYTMAMIHENLYQSENFAQIDIHDYVKDIVEYFFNMHGESIAQIGSVIDIDDLSIAIDCAVPLGLILTELISNTLKYAFPSGRSGEISITIKPEPENYLTVTFTDNGIGLPEQLDIRQVETLGLQLVILLTRQLKGNLTVDAKNGTTFKIIFPYKLSCSKDGDNEVQK